MIEANPEIEKAGTGYSLSRGSDEKEQVFEQVRQQKFDSCPSRLKSFYVFDKIEFVERAQKEWFLCDPRDQHEFRILDDLVIHRADTVWLNSSKGEWVDNAHKYWNGEMSADQFPEVLVHRALYFPLWEQFGE